MPEINDAVNKALDKKRETGQGNSLDSNKYATSAYDAGWQNHAFSLPTYMTHRRVLQNPDGTFRYMTGYDGLGTAPLGG